MPRIVTLRTPWDHSCVQVPVAEGSIRDLKRGKCFNAICSEGWMMLAASKKDIVQAGYCYNCTRYWMLMQAMSGIISFSSFWFVENGKLKKQPMFSEAASLVSGFKERVLREERAKRQQQKQKQKKRREEGRAVKR